MASIMGLSNLAGISSGVSFPASQRRGAKVGSLKIMCSGDGKKVVEPDLSVNAGVLLLLKL